MIAIWQRYELHLCLKYGILYFATEKDSDTADQLIGSGSVVNLTFIVGAKQVSRRKDADGAKKWRFTS